MDFYGKCCQMIENTKDYDIVTESGQTVEESEMKSNALEEHLMHSQQIHWQRTDHKHKYRDIPELV